MPGPKNRRFADERPEAGGCGPDTIEPMRTLACLAVLLAFASAVRAEWPDPDARRYADFAAHRIETLDWRSVLDTKTPVVYLGIDDLEPRLQHELIDHLDDLVAARITHIGVEYGDDLQPEFDKLSRGEVSAWDEEFLKAVIDAGDAAPAVRPKILETLLFLKREGVQSGGIPLRQKVLERMALPSGLEYLAGKTQAVYDAFAADLQLMDAVRGKLKVVALDMPRGDMARLEQICKAKPRPAQCRHYDEPYDVGDRDFRMSSNISRALAERPGARILVLVGAHHTDHANQPSKLALYGHRSKSFRYSDGDDGCSQAMQLLDLKDQNVFVDGDSPLAPPVPVDGLRYYIDGCVYQPR